MHWRDDFIFNLIFVATALVTIERRREDGLITCHIPTVLNFAFYDGQRVFLSWRLLFFHFLIIVELDLE